MACCVLASVGVAAVVGVMARLFRGRSKDAGTDPLAWRLEGENKNGAA